MKVFPVRRVKARERERERDGEFTVVKEVGHWELWISSKYGLSKLVLLHVLAEEDVSCTDIEHGFYC